MKRHRTGWLIASLLGATMAVEAATVEECVRRALQDNPDVEAAVARIAAAEAALRQAQSAWLPMLSVSANYARTDNPPQAFMMRLNQRALNMMAPSFNPNAPDDTDNTRLSLLLKYRLFDFGARRAGVAGAQAMLQAREAMAQAVRNELAHAVTKAFYGVFQAQELAAVQSEQVRSLEESLRVARARLQQGAAVRADVLSLEVRLAQAQEDEVRARNAVALAVAGLNTALGGANLRAEELQPPDPAASWIEAPDPEESDAALEAHPALRAAMAVVEARQAALRGAQAARRPVVNAFGSVDWDSPNASDYEHSYLAGVMVEWDLFTGGRLAGAVAEARAEWEAARAEAQRTRHQLQWDLDDAQIRVREARERLAVTARAEESAAEALRLTKVRYEQGAAELAELLNAEVGWSAIRARRVAAVYDYRIALSNLARARGVRADFESHRRESPARKGE